MWTNGIGNAETEGACWDGKYFYTHKTRGTDQVRQYYISDGIAQPAKSTASGLTTPSSITFDGKGFFSVGEGFRTILQLDRQYNTVKSLNISGAGAGWDGITTDGKSLFLTEA
jgi:hypothetical protein